MSKVAKWIFPVAGGVKGVVGTALAVVGFATGNTGLILSGASMVAGAGKKTQGQARQASILSLTLGETQREAAIGLVCTGGSLVDVFNFGGQYGTDKVTRCVALADHAIDGMVGFYIDDTYYPWVGEGLQAAFSNKLSFHFRQATADGHAPPQHVLENGGWVATDRMVGITHIWIDWYVDEKVWPQGHPAIRFVFRGLRVYDPRFDPALGYTGPNPQTWADRSTHRFSRNAKVLRYAYTRGIYAEGHHGDPNYLLIGRGLTAEEAPPERVIPDANLCDEIVDGVARYCADGVISASQQFIEVDGMFAAPSLLGQIQGLKSVDLDLIANKASVASLNAQVARIDGVEAVNATQALALVDLENGKVALSEYNTLKGEVLSARDGAPSLLGKIQSLKSVDLDLEANKASVASVDALTARTANTEADIIDLESALATESGARAEAIEQVAARSIILPGLTKNGDFRNGLTAYTQSGLGWIVGTSGGPGAAYAFCAADGQQDLWTDFYPVDTNLSFSFFGSRGGAGVSLNVLVEWWNSSTGFISYGTISSVPQGGFQRIIIENDARPTNANRFRMLARKLGMGGNVAFTLLKVNTGAYATPWSDDQDAKAVQASVTEQSLAIIDLELQRSLAAYQVEALASGGLPSFLSLISSTLGGYAALAAPVVALLNTISGGAPLVALEAKNGEVFFGRPIYIAMPGTGYHLIVGGGGPSGSQWLLWFGPNSINASTATRTNGALALGTDGLPYVGSAPLGDGLIVNASPLDVGGSRVGGGVATSDPTSLSVTGGLTGASIRWSNVGGDATVYANSPNSGTTTFSATLAVGQLKSAFMEAKVVKSGKVSSVVVGVTLYEESYVPPES